MSKNEIRECRHCRAKRATRARGLCNGCYHNPTIRNQYGLLPGFGGGVGLRNKAKLPLGSSTSAMPGSAEKLAELMRRAETGQELWHPDDAVPDLE